MYFTGSTSTRKRHRQSSSLWGPAFAIGGLLFLGWVAARGGAGTTPSSTDPRGPETLSADGTGEGLVGHEIETTQGPLPPSDSGSPDAEAENQSDHPTDSGSAIPEPAAKSGPLSIVRWRTPLAMGLRLLERGRASDAAAWCRKNQKALTPSDRTLGLSNLSLMGRAHLQMGQFKQARKLFSEVKDSDQGGRTNLDANLGLLLCAAQGKAHAIPQHALEQLAQQETSTWGSAMGAFLLAARLERARGPKEVLEEKARGWYQKALLSNSLELRVEGTCRKSLDRLTTLILLNSSRAISHPRSLFHLVAPGESLSRIASRYKTSVGALRYLNGLSSDSIRAGRRLKIIPGNIVFVVNRWRLTGTLFIGGAYLHQYPVGIGPGRKTPDGTFTIRTKQKNPDWYYNGRRLPFGHPENILGTRWMGFDKQELGGLGAGLGVHGTALPKSVPGRESKGCIRMKNHNVEELFQLFPRGGKVVIQSQ